MEFPVFYKILYISGIFVFNAVNQALDKILYKGIYLNNLTG